MYSLSVTCLSTMKNLFCYLIFPSYDAHRDLHSFPTRRSSDLKTGHTQSGTSNFLLSLFSASTWWRTTRANPDQVRSEEHTSELQSRPHLVCRLLLEKKNHDV